MARQPRLDLPGLSQHVVQRNNNRLPCFLDAEDRSRYLMLLRGALFTTGRELDGLGADAQPVTPAADAARQR